MHISRRRTILWPLLAAGILIFSGKVSAQNKVAAATQHASPSSLGAFSMSLNVKDLAVSRTFYEQLGFTTFGGSMDQNYLIMKNGNALIGLFQGMFEGNILTFNPGWDENAQNIAGFDDLRVIQSKLKAAGMTLISEVDTQSKGPGSFMLKDPDGNLILLDQHR